MTSHGWMRAGMVVGLMAVAGTATASERLVQQTVDRETGAVVRVFRTPTGGRIEVEAAAVRVSKEVAGDRVVTRITGTGDHLEIDFDRRTMAVSSGRSKVSATVGNRAGLEKAKKIIAGSPLARQAADLIGKMGFGVDTPVYPMLLTTRVLILAAAGERAETRPLRRELAVTRSGQIIKAAFQTKSSMTPTECWDAYAKEAIAAYMEYEDCMKDLSWYEFLDAASCAAIYDMRAIGAFSWWLSCVSLG